MDISFAHISCLTHSLNLLITVLGRKCMLGISTECHCFTQCLTHSLNLLITALGRKYTLWIFAECHCCIQYLTRSPLLLLCTAKCPWVSRGVTAEQVELSFASPPPTAFLLSHTQISFLKDGLFAEILLLLVHLAGTPILPSLPEFVLPSTLATFNYPCFDYCLSLLFSSPGLVKCATSTPDTKSHMNTGKLRPTTRSSSTSLKGTARQENPSHILHALREAFKLRLTAPHCRAPRLGKARNVSNICDTTTRPLSRTALRSRPFICITYCFNKQTTECVLSSRQLSDPCLLTYFCMRAFCQIGGYGYIIRPHSMFGPFP